MYTPTTAISKFLDKLIRPLFDKHARATTIIDGVDLIRRLQKYSSRGYLKPTTLLCSFDITDLYTMLPQEESLNTVMEFLHYYGYQKVQSIPFDTIRKLGRIVLTENVFIYEKKFYKQIIGGAMGSAFTLTLANIFMWKWEKELVRRQVASNEIYGRYIDDIFFTSNQSLDVVNQMLDEANHYHPNIKLVRQIGKSLPFLDVFVENKNGIIATSVYHKEAAETYVVPFQSDHPRHTFKNIIDTALTRAVRYSSTLQTFNQERRYIKLMLLYNGYPPRFIYAIFKAFLGIHMPSLSSTVMSWIEYEKQYFQIRTSRLKQPTSDEQRSQNRISTITDESTEEQGKDKLTANKQQKQDKWNKCLIIHYTHEQRLASYKRDIHQRWDGIFK
ncbi:unnamed protein product [Adineta ricciae]|uniref:Reverse transcriptase domain-containing protein n=1 Tax=Adineta ricciae TaxID=249248 RepID=A0A815X4U8_ADIRI|nr:unnamed protein product [Adineta ricciae]